MAVGTNKTITVGNPDTGEMIEITPARIIHFVNMHDELVDLIDRLVEQVEGCDDPNFPLVEEAKELLERAKQEA